MGFLTQTEVTRIASWWPAPSSIPVIADADDGYGNALSTIRTVQEFVQDRRGRHPSRGPGFPKRCGHIAGKTIMSSRRRSGKYRAAVDTRNRLDPDFVIIARTDAYGAVGGSLEEAIRRGRAYADAGVDLVWCELSNAYREPAVAFARAMRETHPNLPLAFNYSSSFKWHQDPNPFTFRELGELGYKFIFITLFAAHAGDVRRVECDGGAGEGPGAGPVDAGEDQGRPSDREPSRDGPRRHFQELEKQYIPGSDERIKGSAGFDDHRMH